MIGPKFDTTFFERYAMIMLSSILGEHYSNLINSDRPDLQDISQGFGIEVTRAIKEDKTEAELLINELAGSDIFFTDADMQDIDFYGYAYGLDYRGLMGKQEKRYWSLALPLKRIIASKVRKVADGFYGNFKKFGLFIFTKESMTTLEIQMVVEYIFDLQKENKVKYQELYIAQTDKLSVCYLDTLQIIDYTIDKDQCRHFYKNALVKS